jgi:hypothetical protein
MPDKQWKVLERQAAAFFGTNRVPMSGAMRNLKTRSDSLHDRLFLEAKYRAENSLVHKYYALHDRKTRPVVIGLRNKNIRGYLLLLHCDALEYVATNCDVVHTSKKIHFEFWVRDRWAAYNLYTDTAEKAAIEEKAPVVVLREKWKREKGTRPRKGFLLLFHPKHLQTLYDEYRAGESYSASSEK